MYLSCEYVSKIFIKKKNNKCIVNAICRRAHEQNYGYYMNYKRVRGYNEYEYANAKKV